MTDIVLIGPDGSNPLGFLAALGVLSTLDDAVPDGDTRLSWRLVEGAFRPVVRAASVDGSVALVGILHQQLRAGGATQPFEFGKNLNVSPEQFRRVALEVREDVLPTSRRVADFMAAFGSEAVSSEGTIEDTAFRTMSGAGHQHFLAFMKQLVEITTADHIRNALFERWTYPDDAPSMRWDPADDRRYALRWKEPSGDAIHTVRGANRLAIEGLRLLPTAPVRRRLETTGFSGRGSRDTFFTWPIWDGFLTMDVVRSVLALSELQAERPPRGALAARGVVEVYRSQRLTVGKYRNFTPARAI